MATLRMHMHLLPFLSLGATTAAPASPLTLVVTLIGGLALFLFGLEHLTDALKLVAGARSKAILAHLTTNRFTGVLTGAGVTAVIQSSSVTTVLVVGFVSAGLMTLEQSIGVIMGANIGTTVTAQIIAFHIADWGLVLIAAGFGVGFVVRKPAVKPYGGAVLGLGLIFFGMKLMSDATDPLRSYQPFVDLMHQMDHRLLAVLVAATFTAVVQSSSATTAVIIVLASQGVLTLDAAIALTLGANIGTCVTAMLATIRKPRDAVRAALVHVIFNVLGVVIWIGFVGYLADVVRWLTPNSAARQIANAHTIFNVSNTLLLIGFAGPMATLVRRIVPTRVTGIIEAVKPMYLDDVYLQTPDLALDRVQMEIGRLGDAALRMVRGALHAVVSGTEEDLDRLRRMDNDVDALHAGIITYLAKLSQQTMTDAQTRRMGALLSIAHYFENVGDTVETNLVQDGRERIERGVTVSPSSLAAMKAQHDRVGDLVEAVLRAVATGNIDAAHEVIAAKPEVSRLTHAAAGALAHDLKLGGRAATECFRVMSDVVENLSRIYYFAKRIAKAVADESDEQRAGAATSPPSPTTAAASPTPSPSPEALTPATPPVPPAGNGE